LTEASQTVLVERRDRVLWLTLNRPDVLNAQNQAMRDQLWDAIELLEGDDDLALAIVTGAGGRAFSAGADIKEGRASRERDPGPRPPVPVSQRAAWRHFEAFRRATKPTIAAIDGFALGGGLELAMYCDVRLCTEASLLGQPEPRTVRGPAGPALHLLSRLVPMGEALAMQLTSQPVTGRRAYEIGLVQRLLPDRESLMAEAEAMAGQMLECSLDALRHVKRIVRLGGDMSIEHSEALHLAMEEARHWRRD
jgi:enoyl-CoA hydratase/carnithine racemase